MLEDVRVGQANRIAWENRRWSFVGPLGAALTVGVAALSLAATPESHSTVAILLWVLTVAAAIVTAWVWFDTGRGEPPIPESTKATVERLKSERADSVTYIDSQLEIGRTGASSTIETGGTYRVQE